MTLFPPSSVEPWQQDCSAVQQVPRFWSSPQHFVAGGAQHWPRQLVLAGASQQIGPVNLMPEQPLAGGVQVTFPHCGVRSAQTLSKQLTEQQSLSCVQACPLARAHFPMVTPSAQQVDPLGQLVGVQGSAQRPLRQLPEQQSLLTVQESPFGWAQATPPVPQKPLSDVSQILPGAPGSGLQQPSGHDCGVQTQSPFTQMRLGGPSVRQLTQPPPSTPHVVSSDG